MYKIKLFFNRSSWRRFKFIYRLKSMAYSFLPIISLIYCFSQAIDSHSLSEREAYIEDFDRNAYSSEDLSTYDEDLDPRSSSYRRNGIRCNGLYTVQYNEFLFGDPVIEFSLSARLKECSYQFSGSIIENCTVAIACKGKVSQRGGSTRCGTFDDYFEVSDAKNGQEKICGSSEFDGIPKVASNNGTDLFVKYLASSDATCQVYCLERHTEEFRKPTPLKTHKNLDRKTLTTCVCGKRNITSKYIKNARVVGGTDAGMFEFPWIAPIVKRNDKMNNSRSPFCAASLINDRYALTAAHCIRELNQWMIPVEKTPESIQLIFHSHLLDQTVKNGENPKDEKFQDIPGWGLPHVTDHDEHSLRVDIEKIILHPHYSQIEFPFDIALLKLKKPIARGWLQNEKILPICLPDVEDRFFIDFTSQTMTVAGWGQYKPGLGSSVRILQKGDVTITKCNVTSPLNTNEWEFGTYRHLCSAHVEGGKGGCKGDSGGPLMAQLDGISNQYILAGITSAGYKEDCTKRGTYTNVQELVQWVYHHTQDGFFCSKSDTGKARKPQNDRKRDPKRRPKGRNLNQEDLSSEEDSDRQPVPLEVLTLSKTRLDEIACNGTYSMTEKFLTFKLESSEQPCKYIFEGSIMDKCTVALLCKGKVKDSGFSTNCNSDNDYFEVRDVTDGKEKICGSSTFDQIPKVARNNGTDLLVTYKASSESAFCSVFCIEDVMHEDKIMQKLKPLPKHPELAGTDS